MARRTDNPRPERPDCCPQCGGRSFVRWGKDRAGHQRYKYKSRCGKTFAVRPPRPLGSMRIPVDRALMCLNLLVEGMSIRGVERVTGTHRDTVCRLLALADERCPAKMAELIQGVEVSDVQADELWGFVGMKEKTKARKREHSPEPGDVWGWVAMERHTKLVLTHHVGHRTAADADIFIGQLAHATAGRFQLTTDGLNSYPEAISYHLGTRVDYAQLIKTYGTDPAEDERRYSPAKTISTEVRPVIGNPDPERICTSHVERSNLFTRTFTKRMARLTCAFSKKWANHAAALALHFAHYNFCKIHRSLRCTPGMAAGVTASILTLADLIVG